MFTLSIYFIVLNVYLEFVLIYRPHPVGIFANCTCVLGEPDGTFPGRCELGEIDGVIEDTAVEMAGDKALGLSEE